YLAGENAAPVAVAWAEPVSGPAPLRVRFTGSASVDPDGDELAFAWDFGDGAGSAVADPEHVYEAGGDYAARLTVGDGRGGVDTEAVRITVDNSPPVATIERPRRGGR